MRRLVWAALFCGSVAASARAADGPDPAQRRADHRRRHGRDDCGAYGNPKVKTPNIDRLAREGMRFDRAFVMASSCSPSRSSIITGAIPHNTDAEELHWPLPPEQITFVEKLKAVGLLDRGGGQVAPGQCRQGPVRRGPRGGPVGLPPGGREGRQGPDDGRGPGVPPGRLRPVGPASCGTGPAISPSSSGWPPSTRTGTTSRARSPSRTGPRTSSCPLICPTCPRSARTWRLYYDEIGRLDRYVGEVLAELDRQGIAGNTLVMFLSDNGRPFPRCKTTLYDSGIRTPFLVRWPGHIEPGSRCGSLVSTIDIAPTVLRLAGIEPGPSVQGQDLSPLFRDPAAKVHQTIFAERNWHDYASHGRAVRSERFKYIRNDDRENPLTPPADAVRSPTFRAMRRLRDAGMLTPAHRSCFDRPRPAEELYDVDADPHELINLAGDPKYAGVLDEYEDRPIRMGSGRPGTSFPGNSPPTSSIARRASRCRVGCGRGSRSRRRKPGASDRRDAAPVDRYADLVTWCGRPNILSGWRGPTVGLPTRLARQDPHGDPGHGQADVEDPDDDARPRRWPGDGEPR